MPTGKLNSGQRPDENARALYRVLSGAKQNALLTCLNNDGLQKQAGAWGDDAGATIAGVTVADLAREGLLSLNSRRDSAQLTETGLLVMGWHHKAAEQAAKIAANC